MYAINFISNLIHLPTSYILNLFDLIILIDINIRFLFMHFDFSITITQCLIFLCLISANKNPCSKCQNFIIIDYVLILVIKTIVLNQQCLSN